MPDLPAALAPATRIFALLSGALLASGLLLAPAALAQGDDCADALLLPDVGDYCSGASAFTTGGSSYSGAAADCTPGNQAPDAYFRFVAEERGVAITTSSDRGSLPLANLVLYGGTCGALTELACSPSSNSVLRSIVSTELEIGRVYYVRVYGSRVGGDWGVGSFNLCVRSFAPGPPGATDCAIAEQVCGPPRDFTLPPFTDAGAPDDLSSACIGSESQSLWYAFTAAADGLLEFELTSENPNTDIDFVVFGLPAGSTDCSDKVALRCNVAGGPGCNGTTGMRAGEPDDDEFPGCNGGNNAFVDALPLERGRSYLLFINNFSVDGEVIRLDFLNSATEFEGPSADFSTSLVGRTCSSEDLRFAAGPGLAYEWNFGAGATPRTSTEASPVVTFTGEPGPRPVTLTLSDGDCSVTNTRSITVDFGFDPDVAIVDETPVSCAGPNTGGFTAEVTPAGDYGYVLFSRDDNRLVGGNATGVFADLPAGDYVLTVADPSDPTCAREVDVTVADDSGRRDFAVDTVGTRATDCSAAASGEVAFRTEPPGDYVYTLGGVPNRTGVFVGLPAGNVAVSVAPRGASACAVVYDVDIPDGTFVPEVSAAGLPAEGDCARASFDFEAVSPRATTFDWDFGADAAPATATGPGPHRVTFSGASGPRLPTVTASAGPRCTATASAPVDYVTDEDFAVELTGTPVNCADASSGAIDVAVTPAGDYVFALDGGTPQSDARFDGLPVGEYTVAIWREGLGEACAKTRTVVVEQGSDDLPDYGPIALREASCATVADASVRFGGLPAGATVERLNGRGDGLGAFGPGFEDLRAGRYGFRLTGANGCTRDTFVQVLALPGPQIDLGPDRRADFGEVIALNPVVTPGRATFDPDSAQITGLDSVAALDASLGGIVFSPSLLPTQTITVTLVDDEGCVARDELTVTTLVDRLFEVPTAFTPNGDGVNEVWYPRAGPSVRRILSARVYSRWGGLLYSLEDFPPNERFLGWDGETDGGPLDAGTYVYVVEVEFVDGSTRVVDGELQLLR